MANLFCPVRGIGAAEIGIADKHGDWHIMPGQDFRCPMALVSGEFFQIVKDTFQ